ncbi:MAG TPA: exopolysaccharide biosynthesis polyprenyl glycosylphosphotransferase [Acidimicrobiales bacterium]|nr:exopolysaccharide biosynthesis polyprenyl glycosylphosphotransferase [Acidimicrobiales bacterium]
MSLTTDSGLSDGKESYRAANGVAIAPVSGIGDDIEVILDDALDEARLGRSQKGDNRLVRLAGRKGRAQGRFLRRRLIASDIWAVGWCWAALTIHISQPNIPRQLVLLAIAVMATYAAMRRAGLYRSAVCALRSLEAVRVFAACAVGTGAYLAVKAVFERHFSVAAPLEAGSASVLGVLLLRWRFVRWLKARRSASRYLRTVVMVGTNEDADELWTLFSEEPELGYRIGGVVGATRPGAAWADLPSSTRMDRIADVARKAGANGVVVVASALPPGERRRVVDEALEGGLHVQVWPGLCGLSARRARMAPVSGVPLLYVEPREVTTFQLAAKRAMDIALAVFFGLLTLPLLAVAALAVKLVDGGPVIYRSPRVGRYGMTISVLKLRTMVTGAADIAVDQLNERKGGPLFKASRDPRVTTMGRILRATSIDELPQLWNVLTGAMSMVGPRPALLHEVEHFDAELRRRHNVRPGITGLWQVEARDNPSFSAYRRLDLAYVDGWTIGLDVAVLASTAHELTVRALRAFAQLLTQRHLPAAPLSLDDLASQELAESEAAAEGIVNSPLAASELAGSEAV